MTSPRRGKAPLTPGARGATRDAWISRWSSRHPRPTMLSGCENRLEPARAAPTRGMPVTPQLPPPAAGPAARLRRTLIEHIDGGAPS